MFAFCRHGILKVVKGVLKLPVWLALLIIALNV